MNSAPHLLPEDRPEFERAVDEALRTAVPTTATQTSGPGSTAPAPDARQLRTMALSAATVIAANAGEEYAHFVGLRSRMRQPYAGRPAPDRPAGQGEDAKRTDAKGAGGKGSGGKSAGKSGGKGADDLEPAAAGGGLSLAGAMGEGIGESAGAGLLAMVSVLVPLLAGTAAVIFLLLGYLLLVITPEPAIAAPMRGAGWVFAVLAAAGIVVGMAELWLTAVRNGAGARRRAAEESALAEAARDAVSDLAEEVSQAQAVWRRALLERGIHPYLEKALADGVATRAPASYAPGAQPDEHRDERRSRLGYSGPDFSSRSPSDGRGQGSIRPRYSKPDFSSPEYGGPEHPPE